MRTKLLISAAFVAASVASSLAQSVYSLNVVGYVNVTLPPNQAAVICNPLDATMNNTVAGGNDVTNLFSSANASPANGSYIYQYYAAGAKFLSPIRYSTLTKAWSGNFTMNPGKGILYFNNSSTTPTVVTFVGEVKQGPYTVASVYPSTADLLGSPVPIGGDITNSTTVVGLAPQGGDFVQTFNAGSGSWNIPSTWSAKAGKWSPASTINVGQGFLYWNNSTTPQVWVSNFTVQ